MPHLRTVQDAVWLDRKLRLTYQKGNGALTERVVDPLGLVAKTNLWYLVSTTPDGPRVFRVSRVRAAALLDEPCERPILTLHSGQRLQRAPECAGAPDGAGWVTLSLAFESEVVARSHLLGYGADVEVLDPPELRASLIDVAAEIVAFYAGKASEPKV